MSTTTPAELLEVAGELGLDQAALEELLGASVGEVVRDGVFASPDEAYRVLELRLRLPAMAAKAKAKKQKQELAGAAVGGALDGKAREQEEAEAAVGALSLLPHAQNCRSRNPYCRCTAERREETRFVNRPNHISYRQMARPKGTPLPTAPWWLRNGGCSRHDVWEWLCTRWKSSDVVEAAVVSALRRCIYTKDGILDRRKYAQKYGAIALAFTLWHLTSETRRRGSWTGEVGGFPRGDLARMLPVVGRSSLAKTPGNVSPGTVTRYLGQLKAMLGREGPGLLLWHQPQPAAAAKAGLPRATVVIDGEALTEAYNIYSFRGAEFVEKNTPSPPSPPLARPVDLRSLHDKPTQIQILPRLGDAPIRTSGGAREGPGARDGRTPASAPPSATSSPGRSEVER